MYAVTDACVGSCYGQHFLVWCSRYVRIHFEPETMQKLKP